MHIEVVIDTDKVQLVQSTWERFYTFLGMDGLARMCLKYFLTTFYLLREKEGKMGEEKRKEEERVLGCESYNAGVWRSGNIHSQSSVEEQTQVNRLASEHLQPLSHLAGLYIYVLRWVSLCSLGWSQAPNLPASALGFQAYVFMPSQQKLLLVV